MGSMLYGQRGLHRNTSCLQASPWIATHVTPTMHCVATRCSRRSAKTFCVTEPRFYFSFLYNYFVAVFLSAYEACPNFLPLPQSLYRYLYPLTSQCGAMQPSGSAPGSHTHIPAMSASGAWVLLLHLYPVYLGIDLYLFPLQSHPWICIMVSSRGSRYLLTFQLGGHGLSYCPCLYMNWD